MKVNDIKENPSNPRFIRDEKFKKLVKSIQEFPEMLNLRPIIINENNVVLGGNMRLKACKEAGIKDVPVTIAKGLTEEQQKEFIIKDNASFGEWDWDMLANEWDNDLLNEWGLDVPSFDNLEEPSFDELTDENINKPATIKITFVDIEQLQKAEKDIKELLTKKYEGAFFSMSAGEL